MDKEEFVKKHIAWSEALGDGDVDVELEGPVWHAAAVVVNRDLEEEQEQLEKKAEEQARQNYLVTPGRRWSVSAELAKIQQSRSPQKRGTQEGPRDLEKVLHAYYRNNGKMGGKEINTVKALLKRESIRFDPAVLRLLNRIWVFTDVNGNGDVDKEEYVRLHGLMFGYIQEAALKPGASKTLIDAGNAMQEMSEDDMREIAIEEFTQDCMGAKVLYRKQFYQVFTQMLDTWTDTIDASSSIDLLQGVWEYMEVRPSAARIKASFWATLRLKRVIARKVQEMRDRKARNRQKAEVQMPRIPTPEPEEPPGPTLKEIKQAKFAAQNALRMALLAARKASFLALKAHEEAGKADDAAKAAAKVASFAGAAALQLSTAAIADAEAAVILAEAQQKAREERAEWLRQQDEQRKKDAADCADALGTLDPNTRNAHQFLKPWINEEERVGRNKRVKGPIEKYFNGVHDLGRGADGVIYYYLVATEARLRASMVSCHSVFWVSGWQSINFGVTYRCC